MNNGWYKAEDDWIMRAFRNSDKKQMWMRDMGWLEYGDHTTGITLAVNATQSS